MDVMSGIDTKVELRDENKPKTGSYKIDSKTPVFKSKPDEDVETWLYKMETALQFANVPENMWLVAVGNYLEGTALELVMTARIDGRTWKDLRTDLIKTFRATFKDFNLRSKILTLRDGGNYDKYLHEFRLLSNQIPKSAMSEAERLTCFIQGLRPKTRVELFLKKVDKLEDAILVASSMENALGAKPKEVNTFVKVNKGKNINDKSKYKDVKCHRCGKMGHVKKFCRVKLVESPKKEGKSHPKANTNQSTTDKTCFKCGNVGHFAKNCVLKKERGKVVQSNMVVACNVITFLDSKKASSNSSLSEYWNLYRLDRTLEGSWHKYDKYVLNYCIHHGHDFCHGCYDLNESRDRCKEFPKRCSKHKRETKFWLITELRDGFVWWEQNQKELEKHESSLKPLQATKISMVEMVNTSASMGNYQLLTVKAQIKSSDPGWSQNPNQSLEMKCGLDTGATHSIMSHKTALKFGIRVINSDKLFKTADGTIQKVGGNTLPLIVEVQGIEATIGFIVIDHSDHDILLGLDWFDQTGAGFYPASKILKFPSVNKRFLEHEDEDRDLERTIDLCVAQETDEIDFGDDVSWELNKRYTIKPQIQLTQNQLKQFLGLVPKIREQVASSLDDLGKCRVLKHKIRTINEDPIYTPPYRTSHH